MKAKEVLIAFETKYGEVPTGAALKPYQLCVKSNGLTSENETETTDCIGGEFDSGGDLFVTGSKEEGDLSTNIYYEQIGVLYKFIFGDPITVDNGDGTFTHTFDTTKACANSATIQNLSDNSNSCDETMVEYVQQFTGVRATSFKHKFAGKGLPEVSVGLKAAKYQDSLRDSITKFDEANKVSLADTKADAKTACISIDGNEYKKMAEFDIAIEKIIDEKDLLCDTKDTAILGVQVSGNLSGLFDKDFYTTVAKGDVKPIIVKYEDAKNFIKYYIDEPQFTFKTPAVEAGARIGIDSGWTAKRSATGTQKLKVELKNSVAAY